jgi:hypothetical protein
VTDAQDANRVANNAVTDDVGIYGHQLAFVGSWNRAATMREMFKVIASFNQCRRQLLRCPWVELFDVGSD